MEQFNQWMLLLSCKSRTIYRHNILWPSPPRNSQQVLATCGETLLQQPFGKVLVNFLPKPKTPCTKIIKTSIIGVQTFRIGIFVKVTRSASIECQDMKKQSGKVGSERWIGEMYRNMMNDSGDIMWFSLILIFSVSFCVWRCWSHIFRCRVCHLNFMSNGQLNVVSTALLQFVRRPWQHRTVWFAAPWQVLVIRWPSSWSGPEMVLRRGHFLSDMTWMTWMKNPTISRERVKQVKDHVVERRFNDDNDVWCVHVTT